MCPPFQERQQQHHPTLNTHFQCFHHWCHVDILINFTMTNLSHSNNSCTGSNSPCENTSHIGTQVGSTIQHVSQFFIMVMLKQPRRLFVVRIFESSPSSHDPVQVILLTALSLCFQPTSGKRLVLKSSGQVSYMRANIIDFINFLKVGGLTVTWMYRPLLETQLTNLRGPRQRTFKFSVMSWLLG